MSKFERNRIGRLVSHVEQDMGLPVTDAKKVEEMFSSIEEQTEYLYERLAFLGGPRVTKGRFCLDDSPVWEGWHDGSTWNGWATPSFDKETASAIIAWCNRNLDADETPSVWLEDRQGFLLGWDIDSIANGEVEIDDVLITADKAGRFTFDGWCWWEEE